MFICVYKLKDYIILLTWNYCLLALLRYEGGNKGSSFNSRMEQLIAAIKVKNYSPIHFLINCGRCWIWGPNQTWGWQIVFSLCPSKKIGDILLNLSVAIDSDLFCLEKNCCLLLVKRFYCPFEEKFLPSFHLDIHTYGVFSIRLSVCLSVYLSVCLSIYLSVCLFVVSTFFCYCILSHSIYMLFFLETIS